MYTWDIQARMARLISSSIVGLCAVTRRINPIFIHIIGGKSVFIFYDTCKDGMLRVNSK